MAAVANRGTTDQSKLLVASACCSTDRLSALVVKTGGITIRTQKLI